MIPLDDMRPDLREAVVKLRGLDLPPAALEAMFEVLAALLAPTIEEKVAQALAERDKQWRARISRATRQP